MLGSSRPTRRTPRGTALTLIAVGALLALYKEQVVVGLREAAGLVAAYAQFHLERKVRSLGHVDRQAEMRASPNRE